MIQKSYKILQILPAPRGLWGRFTNEPSFVHRLICLALIEEEGATCVVGMDEQGAIYRPVAAAAATQLYWMDHCKTNGRVKSTAVKEMEDWGEI